MPLRGRRLKYISHFQKGKKHMSDANNNQVSEGKKPDKIQIIGDLKVTNLGKDKLSDNGVLIPATQVIERPRLVNGQPIFNANGDELTEKVAILAISVPSQSEIDSLSVKYFDSIQAKYGGSSFGTIKSLDHTDYKAFNRTIRKGCDIALDGHTWKLQVGITMMNSKGLPNEEHTNDAMKHPLHKAGYRLVVDEHDGRAFYHLRSNKPATTEEVNTAMKANGATGDPAFELINGSTARTGA